MLKAMLIKHKDEEHASSSGISLIPDVLPPELSSTPTTIISKTSFRRRIFPVDGERSDEQLDCTTIRSRKEWKDPLKDPRRAYERYFELMYSEKNILVEEAMRQVGEDFGVSKWCIKKLVYTRKPDTRTPPRKRGRPKRQTIPFENVQSPLHPPSKIVKKRRKSSSPSEENVKKPGRKKTCGQDETRSIAFTGETSHDQGTVPNSPSLQTSPTPTKSYNLPAHILPIGFLDHGSGSGMSTSLTDVDAVLHGSTSTASEWIISRGMASDVYESPSSLNSEWMDPDRSVIDLDECLEPNSNTSVYEFPPPCTIRTIPSTVHQDFLSGDIPECFSWRRIPVRLLHPISRLSVR